MSEIKKTFNMLIPNSSLTLMFRKKAIFFLSLCELLRPNFLVSQIKNKT